MHDFTVTVRMGAECPAGQAFAVLRKDEQVCGVAAKILRRHRPICAHRDPG
jgi:hypothetical protein